MRPRKIIKELLLSNNLALAAGRRLQSCFKDRVAESDCSSIPMKSHNRLGDAPGQDQGDVVRLLG